MKKCSKCGEEKLVGMFHKNKSTVSGYANWCKTCDKVSRRKRGRTPSGKLSQYKRYLRNQYGLTIEQYDFMLARQNSVCNICRQPESSVDRNGVVRHLSVDHDHKTGKIRGLLCIRCNATLGLVQDSIPLLENLIQYLGSE